MDRISRSHRAALGRLDKALIRELRVLWEHWTLDPASWDRFAVPAALRIREYSLVAASLGTEYYRDLRRRELGAPLSRTPARPAPTAVGEITRSLRVTGLAGTYIGLRLGRSPEEARAVAFRRVARAAQRLVVNAERDVVVRSVRADPQAVGWFRQIAGTCDYCVDLASAGVVPPGQEFNAHDGCRCLAVPKFPDPRPMRAPRSMHEMVTESNKVRASYPAEVADSHAIPTTTAELRQGIVSETAKAWDARIAEYGSTSNTTTSMYRVIPKSIADDMVVGQTFRDRGFLYVHEDPIIGTAFPDGACLELQLPSGTRWLWGDSFPGERILGRDIEWRVLRSRMVRAINSYGEEKLMRVFTLVPA